MKILLITVAGTSSRFGKSIGRECLKCIYFKNSYKDTLLYKTIFRDETFDKYVIVGGYKFDELKAYADKYLSAVKDKIVLLENERYADYGSGYSLFVGLDYAVKCGFDQLVFAEGDLWVDRQSFKEVSFSAKDVITFNRETIDAQKSVVFYYDTENRVHYIYDTAHNCLEIKQPFMSIYNSGQIWKFTDFNAVKTIINRMSVEDWYGTNLVFIQNYFGGRDKDEYLLAEFKEWYNCNTVEDYNKIAEKNK